MTLPDLSPTVPFPSTSSRWVGRHSRIASLVSASPLGRKLFPTDFESLSAFFAIPKIRAALTGCDLMEAHYPLDGLIFPFLPRSVKKVLHFHGSSPPPVFRRSWKLIRHHVDCSVACSEYAAGELQKVLDGAVIKVVYNGIDVDMFTPEGPVFFPEADYDPDRMKIGTVARLSRDKGTDLLCEVAKRLQGTVELFLAGPCDAGFDDELKTMTDVPNIHVLGPVDYSDIPCFLPFSRLFRPPFPF